MTSTTTTSAPKKTTEDNNYYISITGLKLKSIWYFRKFHSYSAPSMKQAAAADGNISATGTYRNGILHTLTVWKDRKSMVRFMVSGAHAQAMKINDEVSLPGATKVYGYETHAIPSWDEAIALWEEHGTRHGVKPTKKVTTITRSTKKATTTTSNAISRDVETFYQQHRSTLGCMMFACGAYLLVLAIYT